MIFELIDRLRINIKPYCAMQNAVRLAVYSLPSIRKIKVLLVIVISFLFLPSCGDSNRQRNVPVVRLPTIVEYSQDPRFYIVRPGDTLYSIAWHHGLDYRALARKNNILNGYKINIGQKLRVNFTKEKNSPQVVVKKLERTVPSHSKNKELQKQVKVNSKASTQVKSTSKLKKSVTNWQWPVNGKVVAQFSSSRGGNKGIDIATTGPQPVRAVANGTVVYSGDGLRGYGKLVIIKHSDDYLTAYAYNARIRVKEKIEVKVGDIIADTGVNGLHKNRLHLEVRFKGKPVNPLTYLK